MVPLILVILMQPFAPESSLLVVDRLRTEYMVNPIGIDVLHPRLSWQLLSEERGVVQAAYQIQVATEPDNFEERPIWDSGRVESSQSVHVPYAGPALQSRERSHWRVRVWDGDGRVSSWSEPAFWEMGLLDTDEWTASWISPGWEEDLSRPQPAPLIRREFVVADDVRSARLYVTSLGLYEMHLNGQAVGDQVFTPGWTSYDHRLQYQTYDVTDLVENGANAIGAWLGDGWFRGYLRWDVTRNYYGDRLALLAQLEIRYEDGTVETVRTDSDWMAATGPIRSSDIYMGEVYDARLEENGWDRAGFSPDDRWSPVEVIDHPFDILVAASSPPVRRIQEVRPVAILESPNGNPVVDMGQNMVGRVRIRISASTGAKTTMRHAEVLNEDGSLYAENLREALQEVSYVAAGRDGEVYEPKFTFQGFRYVEVTGYRGELSPDNIRGIVIHSDLETTGVFETSNELINKLQQNIVWSQKGNFLDVPTDCPQRDERLGWTGDAQVFAPTAAFNMLVAPFFSKWLADLVADQMESGSVPWVIPDVVSSEDDPDRGHGATGWGDAVVVVPWVLYERYADVRILREQYAGMREWIEFMKTRAGEDLIWDGDEHFGDWLAYAPAHPGYPGATTSTDLIATAYFAHSTDLLGRVAGILGKTDDERELRSLFESIRAAFQSEFISSTGRLVSDTQTAYALALDFGLVPESLRGRAVERMVENVRSHGHMTTGFLGAPLLTKVLAKNGHLELAYELLLREEYPSWLYPVKSGATTIWERWDSLKPDGSFQDPGMNSFNHYAYGAVGDWMYRVIAGINPDPDEPGYSHVIIYPRPGGGLRFARASLETMYGEVRSEWQVDGDRTNLNVTIPPNSRATVRIPDARLREVTEGGRPLDGISKIRARQEERWVEVEIGSGSYRFVKN